MDKAIYKLDPAEWPQVLTDEEQSKLLKAAAEGENPRRDRALIAAMLYLGMSAKDAAKIHFYTAIGDAVEDRNRRAMLHIPAEYKHIIGDIINNADAVKITDLVTECSKENAKKAVKEVFDRAGINGENGELRLRRTAAKMHHWNEWTRDEEIELWFNEVNFIKGEREIFYCLYSIDEALSDFNLLPEP